MVTLALRCPESVDFNTGEITMATQVSKVLTNARASSQVVSTAELPMAADLTRLGGSFHILSAATAALTAVPTTTSGHSLWNGDSQKCYLIDSFGCVEIVTDATQQNSLALFAMMNKGSVTAPTDAGLTRGSFLGNNYGGNAKTAAAVSVTNDIWTPHGPSAPGATAFAGAVWRVHEREANGMYVVRPGGMFNIAAVKTVATASQIQYFIRWTEVLIEFTSS
jgi:hypothetical protein